MPPRKIKKDPKADWLKTNDGRLVDPNSLEGLRLRGVVAEEPPVEPYTEELVPANAAATMAEMPQTDGGLLLYKKLPGDVEVHKMHVADENFPDNGPYLSVTCDTDDVAKVVDAVLGDGSKPRYKNPKTGLEFEWTVAPPGFFAKPSGWDKPKIVEDFADAPQE
mmetsp:Transcript_8254/g.21382  ORF Transcript_8254/g.21382 Transcript_8254/m.21382 type:complete len:164 (-) Transcript_8254:49-540(-)